jgi:hypothetical protein
MYRLETKTEKDVKILCSKPNKKLMGTMRVINWRISCRETTLCPSLVPSVEYSCSYTDIDCPVIELSFL